MIGAVDGVVASMAKFEYLISAPASKDRDWKQFHREFRRAEPIRAGARMFRAVAAAGLVTAWESTRLDQFAVATDNWLRLPAHQLPHGPLQMRSLFKDGTSRPAVEVKVRHWWQWNDKYGATNPVVAWVDADPASVDALRANGCPAWLFSDLYEHFKAGALISAIANGPEPVAVLHERAQRQGPIWKEAELAWQEGREEWKARHKLRLRTRQAEERARQLILDRLAAIEGHRGAPEQLTRLQDATELSHTQLQDLIAGRQVTIAQERYDYLYELMRDLDGIGADKIARIGNGLSAEHNDALKAGIADAMQIISNPQISAAAAPQSKVSSEGVGGIAQLPSDIQSLLREQAYESDDPIARAQATGGVVKIARLPEFEALADLLNVGDERLAQGTDLDRGLLRQAAEIAAGHDGTRLAGKPDSLTANELADRLLYCAGVDHAAVHDFLTGDSRMTATSADEREFVARVLVAGVLNHDWRGHDEGIAELVFTAGEFADSDNEFLRDRARTSAKALAGYLMAADGTAQGVVNATLADALARTVSGACLPSP